jgi:hypothetical protein
MASKPHGELDGQILLFTSHTECLKQIRFHTELGRRKSPVSFMHGIAHLDVVIITSTREITEIIARMAFRLALLRAVSLLIHENVLRTLFCRDGTQPVSNWTGQQVCRRPAQYPNHAAASLHPPTPHLFSCLQLLLYHL